jgi:IS30 family transposase
MPGAVGKTAERARYIELTRQGLNNAEICRQLGIPRKTGSKWRNGYKDRDKSGVVRHYAPIVEAAQRAERTISARFLSEDERVAIADMLAAGQSLRRIAASLGRAPSTVSREVRRNSDGAGKYRPFHHAHKLAQRARRRERKGKIAASPELRAEIEELMGKRWSPAQISRHLRTSHPDDPTRRVVHETIYRDIYDWRGGALRRDSARLLRTKRNRRRPSRLVPRRRSRFGPNVLTIADRPFEPTDRTIAGHWEGDLIMGRNNSSAIATLVERPSRFLLLLRVDAAQRADSLRDSLIRAFLELPEGMRRSITWDQGWEMARHAEITLAAGAAVYFCDPHSPWQRLTNENTNRLLRDYFPKRTDLNVHGPAKLRAVAAELNARPRKTLGWATPEERFATLLAGGK